MVTGSSIEDKQDVSDASLRRRLLLISFGVMFAFSLLTLRIVNLQVVASEQYRELANGNRVREEIVYAPRGKIFDRDGVLLADNTLEFQLSLTPYLLPDEPQQQAAIIARVSRIVGLEPSVIETLLEDNGTEYVLPLPIESTVTHEQALQIGAAQSDLLGFRVDRVPSRAYKSDSALAHIVGYIGRVSEDDLATNSDGTLLPTDVIGKTGVELSFDDRLRGQNGWTRYEVDALGRPVRIIDQREPRPGEDIQLSIDYDVQQSMHDALVKQMKEAESSRSSGVAVDPHTGELLAMVSLPSYDNNQFVGGIGEEEFARYNTDPNQPLYNKALAGGFTSGSIIKPLVAAAALQEGIVTEHTVVEDNGYIDVVSQYGTGTFRFRGWRESGLGPMNVRSALAWSSNIYFYTVGGGHGGIQGLGESRLSEYYRAFGLGEPTGINMPGETSGRVPNEAWKLDVKGEPWYVGDSYNISIGQGDLLISPLQITMAEAAIANGGEVLAPVLEKDESRRVRREVPIDKSHLQIVREGMRQVLTDGTTCECVFKDVPHKVAGKSGTAETNTPDGRPPHAWYTAFAPYHEDGQTGDILATVLIEEGEGGSQYAAPAIAESFSAYFAQD